MSEQCRVVKVTYSEELQSEAELWLKRYVEKMLLDHISKNDLKLRALLISEKILNERTLK
ncbi:hypothetical protein [Bacillus sp. REN10]|uniref:hypothetical protein n=1 Tax=Bacillus sp. REN10 TaxID=2782541 RepID=UPI00193C7CCA|nr:hypothetical protein [Bacillus sp. REN10]